METDVAVDESRIEGVVGWKARDVTADVDGSVMTEEGEKGADSLDAGSDQSLIWAASDKLPSRVISPCQIVRDSQG